MLTLRNTVAFDAGHLATFGASPSTWLFLTRKNRLFAVDSEGHSIRYELEIPGSSSASKLLVMGDRFVVSRYLDRSYVLSAHDVATGSEFWRTRLPLTTNAIFETLLTAHAEGLTVVIRNQAIRIDPSSGDVLAHVELEDEASQTATTTTSERLYVRYRNSFGFVTPDLRATRLLEESPLEITAGGDHVHLLPRGDGYIAIWDAELGTEANRIDTSRLRIEVESISPLLGDPNRLALRLERADVAAVLDIPSASLLWKLGTNEQRVGARAGFRAYLLTTVDRGLVVTLWSSELDEELSVLCSETTGEERFAFGRGKRRHASVPGHHLTYDKHGLNVFAVDGSPATQAGYLVAR